MKHYWWGFDPHISYLHAQVLASLTKAEHRSVSGLFTRRHVALEWEEIEMRPWERRELQRRQEYVALLALVAVLIGQTSGHT